MATRACKNRGRSPLMRVSRSRLEEIRDEYLAEDLVITDDMLGWTESQAEQYFESGGKRRPPETTAPQATLVFGAPSQRFTLPDGTSLAYELWGNRMGPKVLVLSGIGMTLGKSFAPLRKALGQCCCLTFEHRGTGSSSMPTERWPPPSIAVFAEDALKLISGGAGWRSCHVVGISFGGLVAQELALLCPSVLERLVLICTAAPGAATERATLDPLQAALALPDEERLQSMLLLADTRRDDEWLESEVGKEGSALLRRSDVASKGLPGGEAGRKYQATARAQCELASRWAPTRGKGGQAGESRTGEHTKLLAADDYPSGAPPGEQLGPRCCVMAAVHDGICQPAYALKLVELLPGCTVCWFDSGHWPIPALEHSADFNEALGEFLVRGTISEKQQLRSAGVAAEHVPNNDNCCSGCVLL